MQSINPAAYITDLDPADAAIVDASGWYESETAELKTPESRLQLPWLLAQGWVVEEEGVTDPGTGEEGEPFIKLKRRRLIPEKALKDLVESFTNAYNEGRTLNDRRYDEILAVYNVLHSSNQVELNALQADDITYNSLVTVLIAGLSTAYNTHYTAVDGAFDDYGDSQRERIATQFDNQLTASRASMIARGIYNTTAWDSVEAGIERERATALTDLEDKILERQVSLADRLFAVREEVTGKVIAAHDRLRAQFHDRDVQRIGVRNTIVQALLAFMERREDGYPDLTGVGNLAASMGASQPTYPAP